MCRDYGPVAAFSVPANIGELTLTLTSEVNKQTSVFAPNVLILDQNMTPSAFFPANIYLSGAGRDERRPPGRKMRLTPALGQQKIYVLVFTTERFAADHQAYRSGESLCQRHGNSVPDIPDPISPPRHRWLLKLKVKTTMLPACWLAHCLVPPAPAL
jgi:maltose operon protein